MGWNDAGKPWPRLAGVLLLLGVSTLAVAENPLASPELTDEGPVVVGNLPKPLVAAAVASDGSRAFIFGGASDPHGIPVRDIVVFDPVNLTASILPCQLPVRLASASAIWDGVNFYVFGGWMDPGATDQIVRFNPISCSIQTVAHLPSPRYSTSAIWDGTHAYVFGGKGSGAADEIVRFEPAAGMVTTTAARLPSDGVWGASAAWTGSEALIFGGFPTVSAAILRYVPETDRLHLAPASLPSGRVYTSAAFGDGDAFVFGGGDGLSFDDIVRVYDRGNAVIKMDPGLPSELHSTGATWIGDSAYIFGGSHPRQDKILRYTPPGPLIWPAFGTVTQNVTDHGSSAIDIAGTLGSPVVASAAGEVIYAGTRYNVSPGACFEGGGTSLTPDTYVVLRHEGGYYTEYLHLASIREDLLLGYQAGGFPHVGRGEELGSMGHSGCVAGLTGVHVHFEISHTLQESGLNAGCGLVHDGTVWRGPDPERGSEVVLGERTDGYYPGLGHGNLPPGPVVRCL